MKALLFFIFMLAVILADPCSSSTICPHGTKCNPNGLSYSCTPLKCGDFPVPSINHFLCKNGGLCKDNDETGFECCCREDTIGQFCEHVIRTCNNTICHNGGTCHQILIHSDNGSIPDAFCECKDGYGGANCEYNLCHGVNCENGHICELGKCNMKGQIGCRPGYTGDRCQYITCHLAEASDRSLISNGSSLLHEYDYLLAHSSVFHHANQSLKANYRKNFISMLHDLKSRNTTLKRAHFRENFDKLYPNHGQWFVDIQMNEWAICSTDNRINMKSSCIDTAHGYQCNCPYGHQGKYCTPNWNGFYFFGILFQGATRWGTGFKGVLFVTLKMKKIYRIR